MKSKIASSSTIEDAAAALGKQTDEAMKVRFSNPYVNNVGLEPMIVSKAFGMSTGQLSQPIIGANGVFIIQINSVNVPENSDLASAEFRLKYGLSSRASYEGYEALQEKAEIKDERIKFF